MGQGVEIYGPDGSLKFGVSDRLSKFLTSVAIGTAAGSVYVPGLNTGTPFVVVTARDSSTSSPSFSFLPIPPTISADPGSQIVSWSASTLPEGWILTIGVY